MISITCTNCRANLTIDDAFAGGVCRCQYCGTIQTVPVKGRPTAAPAGAAGAGTAPVSTAPQAKAAAPPPAASAPKTLYENKARVRKATSDGTGLDDLANAVATSSGLSGSGLSSRRHTAQSADRAKSSRRKLLPILLIIFGVIIVLLGAILFVVLSRNSNQSPGGNQAHGTTPAVAAAGSDFCGIPLHAANTIFLLDRGNSISEEFDGVKAVCFKSIDAFGPGRTFQVILWDNGSSPAEFPAAQPAPATDANVNELRRTFQDTIASGRSHLAGVLKEAAARNPQEIVIVTGKGADDLDDNDSAALQSMLGKNIRIDAVQVYPLTASPNPTLQEVARATGGQYRNVSAAQLRDFAH